MALVYLVVIIVFAIVVVGIRDGAVIVVAVVIVVVVIIVDMLFLGICMSLFSLIPFTRCRCQYYRPVLLSARLCLLLS